MPQPLAWYLGFVLSQIGADLRNTIIYTLAGLFGGYLIADLFLRIQLITVNSQSKKRCPMYWIY